jgi:tRNA threonylcarbamoyladenosine biosynthesis protein TsaB
MLLAIDTTTRMAGLALYDEVRGWVLGEEAWYSVDSHTVELMPRVVRMMAQQGVTPAGLNGLVVGLGPGSFTGLRIGLGVAKGLALASSLPLVGIPTLDAVAYPYRQQRLPVWAVLRAGRGRLCVGHYVRRRGRWRRQGDFELTTLEDLCKRIEKAALVCGELDAEEVDVIHQRSGHQMTIATPAASLRRAAYLAELGWERLGQGDFDDAATLSPIYLQNP